MVSAEPTTVGQFRRGEIIGRGNFGVVYKGVDTKTKRVVAIKTLDLDAGVDEVESVQHEVALLSRLSSAESSNVTKYFGSMMVGSKLWIIMDLCSGGSVRTLLKGGPLDDRCLSVIFRETTKAVGAIHREGIIHRDIKAANVLITMTGQVKLCDFGVAAELSLSHKSKRTTIVGTPYWMAPEVITEGRSYDTKADIWSLGVTLYEMVTGNPPYTEYEAMRALMLISKSRPPRLEGPKYAPVLKDVIAICLDEVPDARPTADELLKHKFVKQHAKSTTAVLRVVVQRYLDWKQKNSNHRDSLLMFNPHENGEKESDEFDSGDDAESLWDFNVSPLDAATSGVPGPADNMDEAPDSLREVFGLPPKPQDDFPTPAPVLRRTMTEIVTHTAPPLSSDSSAGPQSAIEPAQPMAYPRVQQGPTPPIVFPQVQSHAQSHAHHSPAAQQQLAPQNGHQHAHTHAHQPHAHTHAHQQAQHSAHQQHAHPSPQSQQVQQLQQLQQQQAQLQQMQPMAGGVLPTSGPVSSSTSASPSAPTSAPASALPNAPHTPYTLAQAQGDAMTPLHAQSQPILPLAPAPGAAVQRHPSNLSRVPTAVYASTRHRSTTVSASTSLREPGRGVWRSRHGSEASTHLDTSQSLAALSLAQAQVRASAQEQQRQVVDSTQAQSQAPGSGQATGLAQAFDPGASQGAGAGASQGHNQSQSQSQNQSQSQSQGQSQGQSQSQTPDVRAINHNPSSYAGSQLQALQSQEAAAYASGQSSPGVLGMQAPQLPRIPRMPSLDSDAMRASEPPSPRASVSQPGTATEQAPTAASTPWNKVPSPKRTASRANEDAARNAKAALPRLVMPARGSVRPPPLMSAPAGPNKQFPPTLPNIRRQTSPWTSEFPPMPKVDTNILLNSTPDSLAAEHLLELLVGFKTAVASLAGQLEQLGPSSAQA